MLTPAEPSGLKLSFRYSNMPVAILTWDSQHPRSSVLYSVQVVRLTQLRSTFPADGGTQNQADAQVACLLMSRGFSSPPLPRPDRPVRNCYLSVSEISKSQCWWGRIFDSLNSRTIGSLSNSSTGREDDHWIRA